MGIKKEKFHCSVFQSCHPSLTSSHRFHPSEETPPCFSTPAKRRVCGMKDKKLRNYKQQRQSESLWQRFQRAVRVFFLTFQVQSSFSGVIVLAGNKNSLFECSSAVRRRSCCRRADIPSAASEPSSPAFHALFVFTSWLA